MGSGADVNAQGGAYGNNLQVALERGHQEIVKLLLDNEADVNAQGGDYGNALYAGTGREIARCLNPKRCWILMNGMLEGIAVVHSVLVAAVMGRSILGVFGPYSLGRGFDIHLGQVGVGIPLVWPLVWTLVSLLVRGDWRHESGGEALEWLPVVRALVVPSR